MATKSPRCRGSYPSGYGNPGVRFWRQVNKQGPAAGRLGRCWLWTGGRNGKYGSFWADGANRRAHVYSWKLQHKTPRGLQVLHRCDTPICVNPRHLFLGTPLDNITDMERKGRHPHKRFALTTEETAEVRRRYRRYSQTNGSYALAEEFGVSQCTIWVALDKRKRKYPRRFRRLVKGGDKAVGV